MNKVAAYLNEHLSGEVTSRTSSLNKVATDGSVLSRRPEMIARVADISDIRKIMRFCSQLAEKGHVLPIFPRGNGTDTTGAGVGVGMMLDMKAHMNRIVGIDPKQQLIHVQAGISLSAVNAALSTHKGLGLPSTSYINEDGTVGGAINTAPAGFSVGSRGSFTDSVQQLEVVLSSGDVIQTGRISKRELNKRKGLTSFEGELYRQLDNLISDNAELISQIDPQTPDTAGYSQIAKVKLSDGSFDLTPLFFGSQGGLGVICEVILKAEFARPEYQIVIAPYGSVVDAQAAADLAAKGKAAAVELVDGRILQRAHAAGKKLDWAPRQSFKGAVMIAVFDDFSDRARAKLAKKLTKKLETTDAISLHQFSLSAHEISELHSPLVLAEEVHEANLITPKVFSGIWLDTVQLASFLAGLKSLEAKYGVDLPIFVDYLSGFSALYPQFDSKKVSDRQRMFHIIEELAQIVSKHEGALAGFGGDGRLKSGFINQTISDAEKQLFAKVKEIFDPLGILAAGVKTDAPAKELSSELNAWCKLHNQP